MHQARVYDISNVSLYALDSNYRSRPRSMNMAGFINAATYVTLLGGLAMGVMRIFGA